MVVKAGLGTEQHTISGADVIIADCLYFSNRFMDIDCIIIWFRRTINTGKRKRYYFLSCSVPFQAIWPEAATSQYLGLSEIPGKFRHMHQAIVGLDSNYFTDTGMGLNIKMCFRCRVNI